MGDARVEGDLGRDRRERLGRRVDPGLVAEQRGELHQHLPDRAHGVGAGDPGPQPLEASVRMRDGALLLGVELGREDDVGVPGRGVLEHRDREDELRLAERLAPRRPAGEVADGVGVEQERGLQVSGREGVADLGRVAAVGGFR